MRRAITAAVRRTRAPGRRLRDGQPDLLLALHLDAGPRGRGDPRGAPSSAATARPRSAPRSPGGPASRPRRCAAPTRGSGCSSGPTSTPPARRDPEEQLAKTASIRAEMHLDAGALEQAEAEARRAHRPRTPDGSRSAARPPAPSPTCYVSRGRLRRAATAARRGILAEPVRATSAGSSCRRAPLLARIALEQGRTPRPSRGRAGRRARGPGARRGPGRRCSPRPCCATSTRRRSPPTSTARRCRGRSGCRCWPRTPATCFRTGDVRARRRAGGRRGGARRLRGPGPRRGRRPGCSWAGRCSPRATPTRPPRTFLAALDQRRHDADAAAGRRRPRRAGLRSAQRRGLQGGAAARRRRVRAADAALRWSPWGYAAGDPVERRPRASPRAGSSGGPVTPPAVARRQQRSSPGPRAPAVGRSTS